MNPQGIRPSIGRIVHYVENDETDPEGGKVCRAAIVTETIGYDKPDHPHSANIHVFRPNNTQSQENCVQDEEGREAGTWHWPERVEREATQQ